MRCPYCGFPEDRVVDSRSSKNGRAIRRRRECLDCAKRYTTYESVQPSPLNVVKKDGRREPYNREKAKAGIVTACRKLPVSSDQVDEILDSIEAALEEQLKSEVTSREIGAMISRSLAEIHGVAYLRFTSVYREFKDIAQFVEEAEGIGISGGEPDDGGNSRSG